MSVSALIGSFASRVRQFIREDDGSTAIEYSLIVSLIFLAILAAVKGFTDETRNMYSEIQSAMVN